MTTPSALKCPACGSHFRKEDFDLAKGLLSCSYCHALMTLGSPAKPGAPSFVPRPELPLPAGLTLNKTRDGIELRRRWFQPVHAFLVVFCLIWNGMLAVTYTMIFSGEVSVIAALFPLGHAAVGLGLAYYTLAGLFNTTTIRVERRALVVRHGPIPWKGPGSIDSSTIGQLYVKRTQSTGRSGAYFQYTLWVLRRDGRATKLIAGLLEPDVLLYIEQHIERALGLEDRGVPGELARDGSY